MCLKLVTIVKLYVGLRFLTFYQNPKHTTFYVFLSCCKRFLEHWMTLVRAHQVMEETANTILTQIPQPVDVEEVTNKYPVLYEQSMNTVLVQEIIRYVPAMS